MCFNNHFAFRLASISTFVTDAINKYQLMQKKTHKKEIRRLSKDNNTMSDLEQKTSKAEVRTEPQTSRK
jgi:hypothetical protein